MNKKGRTYSTVNKIFSLAGRQPVAIMISGSANYIPGDVAWERVIGQFREHIGHKELPELSDYVMEFRQFVSSSEILNNKENNDRTIQLDLVDEYTNFWIREARAREGVATHESWDVAELIYNVPEVGDYLNQGILARIDDLHEQVGNMSKWGVVSRWFNGEEGEWDNLKYTTKKKHSENVKKAARVFCKRHDCPKSCEDKLEEIFLWHLIAYGSILTNPRSRSWKTYSHLAFSGFGKTQITPELITCCVGAEVHEGDAFGDIEHHRIRPLTKVEDEGELRREPNSKYKSDVLVKEIPGLRKEDMFWTASAFLVPFAQRGEMQTILNGFNPDSRRRLEGRSGMTDPIRDSVTDSILEHLNDLPGFGPSRMEMIRKCIVSNKMSINLEISKQIRKGSRKEIKGRREKFRQVTSRVPMQELANFAKTLVALEAEITHYSKDVRSVGGPIDLVTITKEDGFLWVESKQTLDSTKNPRQIDIERQSANIV